MSVNHDSIIAVVPAAGVGRRMGADKPKQYLYLHGKTVLEHTVYKLLSHPLIDQVVVAVSAGDPYFEQLDLASDPRIIRVDGGQERADSVLSALKYIVSHQLAFWVLVHDAARPCVRLQDISQLIVEVADHPVGGILASAVRDTMKRSDAQQNIAHTVDRTSLWHALTPQMFRTTELLSALESALRNGANITDEASAIEWTGRSPKLVTGRADNLKITQPEDLILAEFYLSQFQIQ
jgi:2-C-methyl-D-erythritol 4-phosphate cytidylyltransferase